MEILLTTFYNKYYINLIFCWYFHAFSIFKTLIRQQHNLNANTELRNKMVMIEMTQQMSL